MAESKDRDQQSESAVANLVDDDGGLQPESAEWNADEEFAAEVAPAEVISAADERSHRDSGDSGASDVPTENRMLGWFSLILAVASLFFWPAVLGPLAVLFGFIAWSQGSRTLGLWSVVLGIISFVAFLAIAPMYA